MMAENAAAAPGEVVLDCPSGGGTAFAAAAEELRGRLIAVDLSHAMLRRADARRTAFELRDRVDLVQGDATNLPVATAALDRACCFMSLHCLPHKLAALRELRRVLKPGGILAGATLCLDPPAPWRLAVATARVTSAGFFMPPRQSDLERWGRQAGFDWRQDRVGAMLYFTAVARGGPL
jgi:ubiquinone/menaquinone biosynthesis C-methylase UbiE